MTVHTYVMTEAESWAWARGCYAPVVTRARIYARNQVQSDAEPVTIVLRTPEGRPVRQWTDAGENARPTTSWVQP